MRRLRTLESTLSAALTNTDRTSSGITSTSCNMSTTASLRIATVQLKPCFKDAQASIRRADRLIERIQPNDLDLLVLPEMAFAGYCFDSVAEIEPYLEVAETGASFVWASKTALHLNCYVLIGFPQISTPDVSPIVYSNSLLIVDPQGTLHAVYSKQYLYETDEQWCTPPTQPKFQCFDLPFPSSSPHYSAVPPSSTPEPAATPVKLARTTFRLCPAICMDLNPEKFKPEVVPYAFASFVKETGQVDVVIASMAWLDSDQTELEDEETTGRSTRAEEWEDVKDTLGYWAMRCKPLVGSGCLFVACNRIGEEKGSRFTGSSCVMKLNDPPEVEGYLSKKREGVLGGMFAIGGPVL